MQLRAVLIDDEQPALNILKMMLERTGLIEVVGESTKASEAMRQIVKLQPDVVFLDIEMPGCNGIELAEHLLEQAPDTEIVFVTAYRDYAVEAFELNAVDYLLKPLLPKNLERAVSRLVKQKIPRPESSGFKTKCQITCFGRIEVRRSPGDAPVKWRTAKVEELFAYLLYHRGTIVPKGKIIQNLWPECEAETVDNNLHSAVYRLKKTLRENELNISVTLSGGGYLMELGSDTYCDVAQFESFITSAVVLTRENLAAFENITALYRGDYLEGKDYSWCLSEQVRLQQDFSQLAKRIARFDIEAGEYKKAQQILSKDIKFLPYDEEAYEMLLRVCYLQKDRVSLINYYSRIENALRGELRIEPRPSLKRMFESYLNEF